MEQYSMTGLFNISGAWTDYWSAVLPVNGNLIVDPNPRPPGFGYDHTHTYLMNNEAHTFLTQRAIRIKNARRTILGRHSQ
jgi:hypothetical protein